MSRLIIWKAAMLTALASVAVYVTLGWPLTGQLAVAASVLAVVIAAASHDGKDNE